MASVEAITQHLLSFMLFNKVKPTHSAFRTKTLQKSLSVQTLPSANY